MADSKFAVNTGQGSSSPGPYGNIALFEQIGQTFASKMAALVCSDLNVAMVSICTSLVSTIVSFISSIYLVTTHGSGHYFVFSIPVISTLTSFISQVAMLCSVAKIENFVYDNAVNVLNMVLSSIVERQENLSANTNITISNAFEAPDLIRYAMQVCTLLFTAGLVHYDWKLSDINAFLTLNSKSKDLSKDATSFISDVFSSFGWADLEGKAARLNEYKFLIDQALELTAKPSADYIIDPNAYNILIDVTARIKELLLRPLDKDDYHRFTTVRNQLGNILVTLNQLRADVDLITEAQARVATVGLILEGDPGIGKSEFSHFIMGKICSALSLPTAVYNLKLGSSGKFFETYSNQCAGLINEFGAENNAEGTLTHINSIVSSDPFSFESAFVKNQPCKLRIVTCTSNRTDYSNFIKQLNEGAVCALFSRFVRVRVSDDKFQGRWDANTHRKPDFSHLNFTLIQPKVKNPINFSQLTDTTEKNVSFDHLKNLLVKRCCASEIRFLDMLLTKPTLTEAQSLNITTRRQLVANIMSPHSNSTNTRHCVVRLQGGVGKGKSTIITSSADKLSAMYNLPIVRCKIKEDLLSPSTNPKIYILDDFPIHSCSQEYVDFLNNAHQHSIFFIGTNHCVRYEQLSKFSSFHFTNAIDFAFTGAKYINLLNPFSGDFIINMIIKFFIFLIFTNPACAYYPTYRNLKIDLENVPGITRRLGFMERVVDQNVPTNLPPATGLCLTSEVNGMFSTPNVKYYSNEIPAAILKHYNRYLQESDEIPIIEAPAPNFDPDVFIKIKDFNLWKDAVKTENGYAGMFLDKNNPAGSVIVKPKFIDLFMQKTQIKYWIMPNISDQMDLLSASKTLCVTLRNAFPDITVRIESSTFSYALYERSFYLNGETLDINVIAFDQHMVYFKGIPILPTDFFKFYYYPHLLHQIPSLHKFEPIDLAYIKNWFNSNTNWHTIPVYRAAFDIAKDEYDKRNNVKNHPVYMYFKNMPLATKIIGALLATFAATATIYAIYKFCQSKTSDTKANLDYDPKYEKQFDSYQREYIDKIQSGEIKGAREFSALIQARTGDSNLAQGWLAYDSAIKFDNATDRSQQLKSLCKLLRSGDKLAAKTLYDVVCKDKPIDLDELSVLLDVTSNAVYKFDEHTPDRTLIGSFVEILKKNVCKVRVNMNKHCYGLFIRDKTFVTVAHMISDLKDVVQILWAPDSFTQSKVYSVKVDYLNRDKDLAICQVIDNVFPMQKDISVHLPFYSDTHVWSGSCYYIRPLANAFVYHGSATKHHYTAQPKFDANNPNYRPVTWFTYNYTQCLNVTDVFKSGDCGFPLVTVKDNKCVILGIHNGYDGTCSSFFSPLSLNELNTLKPQAMVHANALEPSQIEFTSGSNHADVPPYNNIINETGIIEDKLWTSCHDRLNVVGRCPGLFFHSNPRYNKKNFHDQNCKLDNPSLPSPLNNRELSVKAINNLPIDEKCRASPLMAQCLKFSQSNPLSIDKEVFDRAAAIQLDLYRQHYGPLRVLRPAEAVNGLFDGPLRALVMETSPGPYIKRVYKLDNKKALFVDVNSGNVDKPSWYIFSDHPAAKELRIHMDAIFESWTSNIPTALFIKDNPKVELLPRDEVRDNGKIRLFCEIDLAFNLNVRRLVGDLTAKMQEFHYLTNVKLGVNPYRDLHWYSRSFPKDADIFGFDVKRMDKNFPSFLMHHFFHLAYLLLDEQYKNTIGAAYVACAVSIVNAVHMMEGLLYKTERGNPSGIVATNTINTVTLELITIYAHIKICQQLPRQINTNTSSSYISEVHGFLSGDNGYLVMPKRFKYTESLIASAYKDFGFEILFDKSHLDGIEWCGREINYVDGFLFPALRKEAIVRQIFWINIGKRRDIPNQFIIVQFEAAMHDKAFFENVKSDIIYISKKVGLMPDEVPLLDYEQQRNHFKRYICGEESSPAITVQGTDNLLDLLNIDLRSKVIMSINWIGRYYEECAKRKVPISPNEKFTQDRATLVWECTVVDQEYSGQGVGARKPEAKNAAFGVLFESRFGQFVTSNACISSGSLHKHSVRYTYDYDHNLSTAFITLFSDQDAIMKVKCDMTQQEVSEVIREILSDRHMWYSAFHEHAIAKYSITAENVEDIPSSCIPETISLFPTSIGPISTTSNSRTVNIPTAKLIKIDMNKLTDAEKLKIDPDYFTNQENLRKQFKNAKFVKNVQSNSTADNPNLAVTASEDAVSQGSNNRGGIAPQATSTIATPQPPEQVIESTGGLAKTTVLNPYGPVNRMTEGAITFDYPSLVYSQFMDTDQTYRITDSMAANQIVLQIPYDPLSNFMNDYIRTYVGLHSRFNGDIIIRVNTISNQTFSGAMTVAWYPTQYPAEVVSRPAIQKYAYQVMALVMPSTEYYILKDARQYLYYRETSDRDIPSRPHLIFAVHLPLRSPLKDGVFADIVVGSRLCNQFDAKFGAIPFYVSNPILTPIGPDNGGDSLNNKSISDIFPNYALNYLNMIVDGVTTLPEYSLIDPQGHELFFDLRSMIPCLTGGVFPDANNRRLIATDFEQGVIHNDQVRVCVVLARLTPPEAKTVSNLQTFIDTCKGDDWLTKCKDAAWIRGMISVFCSRNNSTALNVYTKDTFSVNLVQQTTMMTSVGLVYILCFNSSVPTNNLKYAAMGGIPDQAQATPINIPHNPVLGPIDTTERLNPLPPQWATLKFSTFNPGVVTSNSELAPTLTSDAAIIYKFDELSKSLPADQCLQFELLEPIAQTRVAIVRYLHVPREFVISPADGINYKLYPSSASPLVISQYGVVRTNSGFPQSETLGWLSRFPAADIMSYSYYRPHRQTFSNAAAALVELPEAIINMDAAMADMDVIFSRTGVQTPKNLSWGDEAEAEEASMSKVSSPTNRSYWTQTRNNASSSGTQTQYTVMRDKWIQSSPRTRTAYTQTSGTLTQPQSTGTNLAMKGPANPLIKANPIRQNFVTNYNSNYYTQYVKDSANDKYMDYLVFGLLPLLNTNSNGGLITKPIEIYENNVLTHQGWDFQAHQNELNRQQDLVLQGNSQNFQKTMQDASFQQAKQLEQQKEDFAASQQSRDFTFRSNLSDQQFGQQKELQANEFGQQTNLLGRNQAFEREMSTVDFEHSMINTATGGVFGLVNTAVSKIGDALLENQRFNDESKLMTQNANLQIQSSGMTSQAMKIAT